LNRLSLAPLWTALHALLPQERVTRAVPHRWHWVQHQKLSASAAACLFHFNDEPALRAPGLWIGETRESITSTVGRPGRGAPESSPVPI
jgi:gentisate 1,2-dioxygenase